MVGLRVEIKGQKELEAKFDRMLRRIPKTVRGVAGVGKRFAQRIAPKRSGRLESNIESRRLAPHEYEISSYAFNPINDYPYNLWINLRKLSWSKPYTAAKHRTGTPAYMDKTFEILKKRFPDAMLKGISKSLR